MMKRLLLIATLLLVMMPAVKAQSFEFRYHGQPLADGATVTIEAEEDEWGFGEMCCYTNPSSDPYNGLILKLLSGNTAQGNATVTIDENTFNPSRILWCMGGSCMTFGNNTSLNKDFTTTDGRCQVQFDAEDIQSEGHLLATLTATIGGETHTVKIFFAHNEPELSFEADGLFYKLNSDGASVTVASGGSSAGAVIIPESVEYNGASYLVTSIAPQAFQNSSGLSAVIIPGTVTSIGDYAFRYSGLTFVAIPQSVTSMGSQVFYGCSHLQSMLLLAANCDNVTTGAPNVRNLFLAPSVASIKGLGLSPYHVYSYGSVPPVCDGITFNSYSGTLHVPRQGLAPYFADEYWGNFNNFSGDAVWPATVNLTMSQEAVTMKIGETAQLTATADSIPTGMSTMWFSTNPAVVEVSGSGSLVAKATGEATVIALCGEHFATCQVTVEEETVTISLDKSELTLNMDDIATITPSHTPSIVPVEYAFTCSDNEVVLTQWKNGSIRLLATKPGTAVITVSNTDGNAVPATCEVTVRRPMGDVDGDGRVTTVDVTCLYNHLLDGDDTFAATSDVDGDGYITTADITAIYNILIGNAPLNNATEYTVGGVTFTMVAVEGGTFTMGATAEQGSDAYDSEYPTHQVTLSGFSIGQTEVTQELWQAVMGSNPSYFNGGSSGTNLNRPVEQVSWDDCQAFITKLNEMTGQQFRLPTEAEWEYAARGGNSSQGYKYAGSNTIDDVAWYWYNIPSQSEGTAGYGTQTVATKQPNELGIYDMSGNVWEWCQDWYGSYSAGAQTNPAGPASYSIRVCRGGSWCDYARSCRVSFRGSDSPDGRYSYLGLRLAL